MPEAAEDIREEGENHCCAETVRRVMGNDAMPPWDMYPR